MRLLILFLPFIIYAYNTIKITSPEYKAPDKGPSAIEYKAP
jgi:hypothetical protein